MVARQVDEVARWTGRELFGTNAEKIGTIAGLGYPRRKFGTAWLLVETAGARTVLVPADRIEPSGDRLVLPYPRTYIEGAPAVTQDQPLTREDERRLRLHYGFDSMVPGSGCRLGCGLCQLERRAKRTR